MTRRPFILYLFTSPAKESERFSSCVKASYHIPNPLINIKMLIVWKRQPKIDHL